MRFITLKLNVPIVIAIIGQSLLTLIIPIANTVFLKTPLLVVQQSMSRVYQTTPEEQSTAIWTSNAILVTQAMDLFSTRLLQLTLTASVSASTRSTVLTFARLSLPIGTLIPLGTHSNALNAILDTT